MFFGIVFELSKSNFKNIVLFNADSKVNFLIVSAFIGISPCKNIYLIFE